MTKMLTLLLVCQNGDAVSPFLASLQGDGVRLLVGRHADETKRLLSHQSVDAIVLHEDHLQKHYATVSVLRRLAPQTPVMLLRVRQRCADDKPAGVAAVCCADPNDKKTLEAIPAFLRLVLGKQNGRAAA